MLEIKVPSEIRSYRSKIFAGMNIRQIISIVGALAVGVPLGVFGGKVIPEDILMWAVILSVAPIIAWGFVKYKDMRFEQYMVVLFKYFFMPQKRVYEDTDVNYFAHVKTVLGAKDIRQQRIDSGEIDIDDDYDEEMEGDYV